MKTYKIFAFVFLFTVAQTACGQHQHNHKTENNQKSVLTDLGVLEPIVKQDLNTLLNLYYELKDALVADNGELASQKANEFIKTLNAVKMDKLTAKQHPIWMKYAEKLKFDAEHINETKEVGHQRDHFDDLSNNLWEVAKAFKINDKPAYQQYCPMKKSYWISNEKSIKNPYYGNKMLNCGKVNDTLE
jgi:hypothetical protein